MPTYLVQLFPNSMNPGHLGTSGSGNQNIVCVSCSVGSGFHKCSSYEFLLISVLSSALYWRVGTKSYFSTTELNLVAKHSLAVPSATDFSNSSKNLRYTLFFINGTASCEIVRYCSAVSVFTERSPPLHPFWQSGQLRERINKPFSRSCVAKEIVNRGKELDDVRVGCEGSLAKYNTHDD